MSDGINIGSIKADLQVDSGKVTRGLAEGRKAMEAFERELKQLDRDLNSAAIGQGEFAARTKDVKAAMTDLAGAMQKGYSAVRAGAAGAHGLDVAQAGATRSSKNMGMALMQLGAMADDAQWGLAGVVNNVQPLVYSLTGNMGLAAAAQIATVAGVTFYRQWDDVRQALGDTSAISAQTESLDGFAAAAKNAKAAASSFGVAGQFLQAVGLNIDAGKVAKAAEMEGVLKARQRAMTTAEGMVNHQSPTQRKDQERFTDAVGEGGGVRKLAEGLADRALKAQGHGAFLGNARTAGGLGRSEREEYADLMGHEANDRKNHRQTSVADLTRRADLEARAEQNAREKAMERVGHAALDAGHRKTLVDEVSGDKGRFGDAGDLLSGKRKTEKEAADEAKKSKDDVKGYADAMDFLAGKLMADLDDLAKEAVFAGKTIGTSLASGRKAIASALTAKGMDSVDAEGAAKRAVDKADDAMSPKAAAQEQQRREHAAKARRAELVRAGEKAVPELENATMFGIAKSMLGGMSVDQVGRQGMAALKRAGMSDADAKSTMGEEMQLGREEIASRVAQRRWAGPELSRSEVYATSELTNRVQGGIDNSNESPARMFEKMIDELAKGNKLTEDIARNTGANNKVLMIKVTP